MATGLSVLTFTASTLTPNGSVLSTPLLVSRSLTIATESQPSLFRSLPVSSTMRNRPPCCTNCMMAVFSAVLNRMLGSGITNSSKFARSRAAPPP